MPRRKRLLEREYCSKSDVEKELIKAMDEQQLQREEYGFLANMIDDIEREREREQEREQKIKTLQKVLFCWK